MKRRKKQQPEHESPHEARIVRAVEAAGVSDEERPSYLAFARELERTMRRSPKMGTVPRDACVRCGFATVGTNGVVQSPFSPDFGMRTKRCVEKWFRRGLSGHKLWLIGEALLRNPDSGTAFSLLHR